MSATCYKKPHVDILICIEMTRERNQGIKKNTRYIPLGVSGPKKCDFPQTGSESQKSEN